MSSQQSRSAVALTQVVNTNNTGVIVQCLIPSRLFEELKIIADRERVSVEGLMAIAANKLALSEKNEQ